MLAGGKPVLQVLGSFGDLGESVEAHERVDARPPELPSPEECGRHGIDPRLPPIFRNTDMRLHPDDSGFARGAPSGEPRVRGWFRFANEEPLDTVALLFAADAFPPTAFNARLPTNWTPTLELTVHLRARPMPGWLRAVFTTRFISGGLLEEDGELWDESGRIVAQSRQLALLPRARSASALHDQC